MPSRQPRKSPDLEQLLAHSGGVEAVLSLVVKHMSTAEADRYLHWDELRHRQPPAGLTHHQWWLAEKLVRRPTHLPLQGRDGGKPFWCHASHATAGARNRHHTLHP